MEKMTILKRPEVESITGLSRSSIYAKMEIGAFPKQIKLSERSVGWLESEIQGWINERIAESRGVASEKHVNC